MYGGESGACAEGGGHPRRLRRPGQLRAGHLRGRSCGILPRASGRPLPHQPAQQGQSERSADRRAIRWRRTPMRRRMLTGWTFQFCLGEDMQEHRAAAQRISRGRSELMNQPSLATQLLSSLGAALILVSYIGHQVKWRWMDSLRIPYNLLNTLGGAILAYIAMRPLQV